MTTYVVDLAFDADESKEYSEAGYPLQAHLVRVTQEATGEGDPQWFTKLESGDKLHFRVWDISQGPAVSRGATVSRLVSLWIGFFDRRTAKLAEVHDQGNPLICLDLSPIKKSKVKTSVYRPVRAGWIVTSDGSPRPRPPRNAHHIAVRGHLETLRLAGAPRGRDTVQSSADLRL